MGVAQPALMCAVLLGLLTTTPAAPTGEENQLLLLRDIVTFLDYLQSKGLNLDVTGEKDFGFRRTKDLMRLNPNDLRTNGLEDSDESMSVNKRAYMALCHFKICNMGRKRGYIRRSSHNSPRRI